MKLLLHSALLLFLLVCIPDHAFAQNLLQDTDSAVDSLENLLLHQKHDSSKVKVLNDLANKYKKTADYNLAIKKVTEAITIAQKYGMEKEGSRALVIRGGIYNLTRKHPEALSDLLTALKMREKSGNKEGMGSVYLSIGNTYSNMERSDDALKNYNLSLKIRRELGDQNGIASVYLGIGNIYIVLNDFDKALENYTASLTIKRALNEKDGMVNAWNNIGIVHQMMGDYPSALLDFNEALKITEELGNKDAIAACYLNIGQVNTYLKNNEEAQRYYDKGLALAHEIGNNEWLMQGYSGLSQLDSIKGDYKRAFRDYQLYINYRDSLNNKENTEKIVQLQMQYNFDKQQEAEKLLQEKKDAETSAAAFTQKIIIAGVSLALLLFLFFSVMLLKRIRLTRLQKQIIEEKNRDITDSINYAKRIQEVMLPAMEIKHRLFPDAFVLFQPKDIVSGDFYWFAEKNGKRIIAAVDCTGHGVPGALMSMIGNAFLNEIVNERNITSPELILNELRNRIIHSLKQTGADGESRDGMDIAVLAFDDKKSIVEYAGANNPLWIIRDNKLEEYKADKRPIGYFKGEDLPFHLHQMPFSKGDRFYIFSDGYADQFGGPKGKKYKYSTMKELILSIQEKTMAEQEKILSDNFTNWKGNLEQLDDMLVIGIKA
ncbi:MAG TPA: tetratricopeptide repeat protein [Bacteroidia bacterium]|jgi:serine phosphatase RsbU (regulator of sigma subunit)/tetratricopeptide (TPR) repeat protein